MENKLIETFRPYLIGLEIYSEEDFSFKKSEEIWSLSQMYEHVLSSGYFYFLANINRCLEQRKGQVGGELTEAGSYVLYKEGFPLNKKFERPDAVSSPVIGKTVAHYKEKMPELRAALLARISEVNKDEGLYKTNHFYFGMLNAKQWFLNTEFHMRHHLTQKAELESYLKAR